MVLREFFSPPYYRRSSFLKVADEVKHAQKRREEESHAELSNPYSQPMNIFVPAHSVTAVDADAIQNPPQNPYFSQEPRFDPDAAWPPPPNPYLLN